MKISERPTAASRSWVMSTWMAGFAVALAGGVLTATGLFAAANAAGVPAGIAWLYVLSADGLAVVAYSSTTILARPAGRAYAWIVVVVCAGLSGAAQAFHLATATVGADSFGSVIADPRLRFGVGMWPAVSVAITAHLVWLVFEASRDTMDRASASAAGRRGPADETAAPPGDLSWGPSGTTLPAGAVSPGAPAGPILPMPDAAASPRAGVAPAPLRSGAPVRTAPAPEQVHRSASERTGAPAPQRRTGPPRSALRSTAGAAPELTDAELLEALRSVPRDGDGTVPVRRAAGKLGIGQTKARRLLAEAGLLTPRPQLHAVTTAGDPR